MQKHFILAGLMIATSSAQYVSADCQANEATAANQGKSNENQKKDAKVGNGEQAYFPNSCVPQNNHVQTWSEYFSDLKTRLYVRYILAKDSCADTAIAAKRKICLCFAVLKDLFIGG